MKRTSNYGTITVKLALGAVSMLLMLTVPLSAMSGGPYELSWSTLDGGGGTSTGGQYLLTATIGQPDTGRMTGGGFELLGGFWPSGLICTVDFYEYALFAGWWMDTNCGPGNDWCGGADLNEPSDGKVDFDDLLEFADNWLFYCPTDWDLK